MKPNLSRAKKLERLEGFDFKWAHHPSAKIYQDRWIGLESLVLEIANVLSTKTNIASPYDDPIPAREIGNPLILKAIGLLETAKISQGAEFEHVKGTDLDDVWNTPIVDLRGVPFRSADLRGSYLCRARLDHSCLAFANLTGSELQGASLLGADLGHSTLNGSTALDASFKGSNLSHAALEQLVMADGVWSHEDSRRDYERQRYGTLVSRPSTILSRWKARKYSQTSTHEFEQALLLGANFKEAQLRSVSFRGAEVSSASFEGADLRHSNFNGVFGSGSSFAHSDLTEANFERVLLEDCGFEDANLAGANLSNGEFKECSFDGAKFERARVHSAKFYMPDFSRAKFSFVTWSGLELSGEAFTEDATFHGSSMFEERLRSEVWVQEYRRQVKGSRNPFKRLLGVLWWATCDYGRSAFRLLNLALLIVASYAAVYYVLNRFDISSFAPEKFAFLEARSRAISLSGPEGVSDLMTSIFLSLCIFFNLDVPGFQTSTELGALVAISESLLGWVVLGSLVTVVASRMIPKT